MRELECKRAMRVELGWEFQFEVQVVYPGWRRKKETLGERKRWKEERKNEASRTWERKSEEERDEKNKVTIGPLLVWLDERSHVSQNYKYATKT